MPGHCRAVWRAVWCDCLRGKESKEECMTGKQDAVQPDLYGDLWSKSKSECMEELDRAERYFDKNWLDQDGYTTDAVYRYISMQESEISRLRNISQPVERKPLTEEIVRLASVALREMPRPCKTDWQEAAKRVCEAIVDSLTCEECGGDGIVLASQNSWACSSCNISQKDAQ